MADLTALFSSENVHYCTPPSILRPMRLVLVPKGSGRKLLDPATNAVGRQLVKAHFTADGIDVDGLELRWSLGDCWWNNPPYGNGIGDWADKQHHWGRIVGVPGMSIMPARTETRWGHRLFGSADAWAKIGGRHTFWLPIPLDRKNAAPPKRDKHGREREPYFLRRWYPWATDDKLPEPFLSIGPGVAVGPELGDNGRPQSPPFPSIVFFWADPKTREQDPRDELEALRELVHAASVAMRDQPATGQTETWLAEAECLLGSKRFRSTPTLDLAPFKRLAEATQINPPGDHPISIAQFVRRFGDLGTITVARGRYAGEYIHRRRVGA